MRVLVTCGPACAPIDEVRRITNFSTGELGAMLSRALVEAGHEVICLRGEGATFPLEVDGVELRSFTTNESLRDLLHSLSGDEIHAVFHAAALCDFEVAPTGAAKLSSRAGPIQITLLPASKLIHSLRTMFPKAWLIGWKYELEGTQDDALAAAVRQISESHTDACVVNGRAFGGGFGFLTKSATLTKYPDKPSLCAFLATNPWATCS